MGVSASTVNRACNEVGEEVPPEVRDRINLHAISIGCSKCHRESSLATSHVCPSSQCEMRICDECWLRSYVKGTNNTFCIRCRCHMDDHHRQVKLTLCEIVSCAGIPCTTRKGVEEKVHMDRCYTLQQGTKSRTMLDLYQAKRSTKAVEFNQHRLQHMRLSTLAHLLTDTEFGRNLLNDKELSLQLYYAHNLQPFWTIMEVSEAGNKVESRMSRAQPKTVIHQAPINVNLSQVVGNTTTTTTQGGGQAHVMAAEPVATKVA